MFYRTRAKYKLWRLEKTKRRISAAYAQDIQEARAQKQPYSKIKSIESAENFEVTMVLDEIEHLHSQIVLREAARLRLPRPQEGWERSNQLGFSYLDEEAYAKLRNAIRVEKSQRWDMRLKWMPPLVSLITSIAGLLGIVAGILAILKK